jgi:hypothetical protein
VVTLSLTPFTEITAEVGGGSGGAGGVFGGFAVVPEPVDPPEDEDDEVGAGPDAWNGSLLSKSENDCSCPVEAGGCTALISWVETELAELVTPGIAAPASEGAAGSPEGVVAAGAGAALAAVVSVATWGFEADPPPPMAIIVCAA